MAFRLRQKLTAALLNAACGMIWTPYTTAWTASTPPVLGNGTKNAAWTKVGKTVLVRINLLMGSTTTYGSGDWSFSLPETAAAVSGFGGLPIWPTATVTLDAGTAYRVGIANIPSGASTLQVINGGAGNLYSATVPQTWVATDALSIFAMYEGQ